MKLKVLIADKFPENQINRLIDMGLDVEYKPKLTENELPEASKDVDILVVRSTVVNEKTINDSNKLNLIIRAGSGVNNINIAAANKKGIYVSNCPGKNSIAVAELTMGLILSLDRRIPDNVIDFRNGVWNKAEYSKAEGLSGKNLGLIGVGNIGKEVAKRAFAFGMNVYGTDIARIEGLPLKEYGELNQILPLCDVVSIHLPLTPQTRGLFNKEVFELLKPNTLLVNTSRAEIIDEDALLKAIEEKNIRAALDVFSNEPEGKSGTFTHKFQNIKNIYVTHHIGASTEQAQNAVADETVNIISHFINSGFIDHWVNRAKKTQAKYQLVIKHFDKPGVLASVLDLLKEKEINVEEVENVIFDGGIAACCTMKINKPVTSEMLNQMKLNMDIINISHIDL